MGYGKLPVCIAKTQYSFSDDPKNLECKGDYSITIRELELKSGAGFVVALAGKILQCLVFQRFHQQKQLILMKKEKL